MYALIYKVKAVEFKVFMRHSKLLTISTLLQAYIVSYLIKDNAACF